MMFKNKSEFCELITLISRVSQIFTQCDLWSSHTVLPAASATGSDVIRWWVSRDWCISSNVCTVVQNWSVWLDIRCRNSSSMHIYIVPYTACIVDQELTSHALGGLAGSWRMWMTSRPPSIERMTSHQNRTLSVNACLIEGQSCQLSPRSDLKRQS